MISTSDLRKGVTIEFEGQPCSILDWQHVKIGRGGAIIRMKLRRSWWRDHSYETTQFAYRFND